MHSLIPAAKRTTLPLLLALACVQLLPAVRSDAAFHLWTISQVYSNDDGSVQYIELHVCCSGENFIAGFDIVSHRDGGQDEQRYTIPSDVPGNTANRRILFATGNISGVEPDFVIPQGFVPIAFESGATIDISPWAWAGHPNRVDYSFIPTDGSRSIDGHGAIKDPATVTNYSGDTATVTPPDPPDPPAAPKITELSVSDGSFSISFSTQTSHTYFVEFTDSLGGTWNVLAEIAGSGAIETVSEPAADITRRFYRVTVE